MGILIGIVMWVVPKLVNSNEKSNDNLLSTKDEALNSATVEILFWRKDDSLWRMRYDSLQTVRFNEQAQSIEETKKRVEQLESITHDYQEALRKAKKVSNALNQN